MSIKSRKILELAALMTGCLLMVASCSSEDTVSTTTIVSSDVTSQTIPSTLSVTSATAQTSAASASVSYAVSNTPTYAVSDGTAAQDSASKEERMATVTNATVKSDCFAVLQGIGSPGDTITCYGPGVYFTKHPDHTTPTGGASTSTVKTATGNVATGYMPQGDTGIWDSTEGTTDEACSAAKLNSAVASVAQKVDMALGASAAMLCVAKLDGLTLPAAGTATDLTAAMQADPDVETSGGMTVTDASIARGDDTTAGMPVYTSRITFSMTPPGQTAADTLSVTLKHVPQDVDNTTYEGLMTMVRTKSSTSLPAMPDPPGEGGDTPTPNVVARATSASPTQAINGPNEAFSAGDIEAISVVYKQTSTTLSYKMARAEYDSTQTLTNIFDTTTGEIQADNAGGTDGWSNNLNLLLSSMDSDGVGFLAYAWQANSDDGYTRNFNLSTELDGTDLIGTAYFGFAVNTDNADPVFPIEGMICSWAGPNNSKASGTGWDYIQKQTMALNTTTGIWEPLVDNIAFAPTDSCDWTNVTNSTYSSSKISTAATMGAVTNSLATYSTDYSFTLPDEPTVP
ncbi:MAG: hypothetical protein QNL04_04080 [SAR324 cluster bacterium]|nr:hypothetical protein [SAR324 cluster bacterium]